MLYPDLSSASMISFDTETKDPCLLEQGPGVFRKDGFVMGCSLAVDGGFSEYYSFHHSDTPSSERQTNIAYVKSILENNVPKLGVNCRYDCNWLENSLGIKVNGQLNDIQVAEPLLDEYAGHYSLDAQATKYLGEGKKNEALHMWCDTRNLKGDPRQHIYLMPYSVVRDYALGDAQQPLAIFAKQLPLLKEQNLTSVYEMEMKLYRPILLMQKNGIRVDLDRIALSVKKIHANINVWEQELFGEFGAFNVNSGQQIAAILDKLHIEYPRTAKGNPQIDHQYLEFYCNHPIADKLCKLRIAHKILGTFLEGAFLDFNVNGRIHPEFITMKSDEGGAVTGRMSCVRPNLQQVPSKEDRYGDECRSAFLPEEGCWYGKIDYSQIEYRIIAHYALGDKSDVIKKAFNDNPHIDYHALVQQWIKEVTGVDLERKKVKNLNFGTAYYMGIDSMSKKFGWGYEQSKELNKVYFDTFPFLKPTRNEVVNTAKMRGYVRTILGRRARVSHELREKKKEYIVWNHLVQGTAADINKKAIVDAYEAGIFSVLTPHINVHDENGVSIPKSRVGLEAYRELKNIMENAVKLKVPIIAEAEIGSSWGETEACDFDKMEAAL